MTKQEKREEREARIKQQLKAKVRKHRPAAKVLELAIFMTEEHKERVLSQVEGIDWELRYLKELDPKEIEPEENS